MHGKKKKTPHQPILWAQARVRIAAAKAEADEKANAEQQAEERRGPRVNKSVRQQAD